MRIKKRILLAKLKEAFVASDICITKLQSVSIDNAPGGRNVLWIKIEADGKFNKKQEETK